MPLIGLLLMWLRFAIKALDPLGRIWNSSKQSAPWLHGVAQRSWAGKNNSGERSSPNALKSDRAWSMAASSRCWAASIMNWFSIYWAKSHQSRESIDWTWSRTKVSFYSQAKSQLSLNYLTQKWKGSLEQMMVPRVMERQVASPRRAKRDHTTFN